MKYQNYKDLKIYQLEHRELNIEDRESRIKHRKSSFSIIEMIIVVLVIGIISTMILANYRTGQRIEDLVTQTQRVVIVLKRAQNMALTGYTSTATRTDCGYGVKITANNTYRLFIDKSSPCNYIWDDGVDTNIQDFSLASGIIFDYSGQPDCTNTVFSVPLGTVYCNGTPFGVNDVYYLKVKQSTENRLFWIRINYSGQISISMTQS